MQTISGSGRLNPACFATHGADGDGDGGGTGDGGGGDGGKRSAIDVGKQHLDSPIIDNP